MIFNFLHLSVNLKKLLFSVLCVFLSLKGFSGSPRIIDTLKIHQQIKSYGINEDLLNFNQDFFKSIIFKNDSTILYNPNGTLLLFEIRLDTTPTVLKLSNGQFNGHNFKRSLFVHNEVIYSFGGEGLFNFSTKLIYFDTELKGWYEKEIQDYPFDSRKVVNSWKYGNKIMVLLNHYSTYDSRSTYKYIQYSFGEIDLTSFKYKTNFEFESDDSGLSFSRGDYIYESDRYLLIGYKKYSEKIKIEIFDKKSGELLKTPLFENLHFPDGNTYIYIDDSIIYYKNNLVIVDSIDINSLYVTDKKNFLQHYNSKKKTNSKYWLMSLVLIIPIFSILFFRYRKRESKIEIEKNVEILEIEGKLQEYINKRISREELDDLLGISHYSYETIKKMRSLLINQINERNILIVERLRNQDDKRYFEYKITKS